MNYNAVQIFIMSFYSKGLYRFFGKNLFKGMVPFVVVTSILFSIPDVFDIVSSGFSKRNQVLNFFNSIPSFEINDGKMIFDSETPYFYPAAENPIFEINASGSASDLKSPDGFFLITKDSLYFKGVKAWNPAIFKLSDYKSKEDLMRKIYDLYGCGNEWFWGGPFLAIILGVIWRFGFVFVYGLIGLFLQRMFSTGLSYKQIVTLAAIFTTPSWFWGIVIYRLKIFQEYWFWVGIALSLLYLFFALWSNSEKSMSVNEKPKF
jgi:hypothetical protein